MRRSVALAAILVLAVTTGITQAAPRRLILQVETAPLAWGASQLSDQMVTLLSRNPDIRVVTADPAVDALPSFPEDRYNLDSLFDWGTEVGGRYLLLISVEHESLERRKTFNVPLFFQRWETIGVIQGESRLLDLQKRRLLSAKPFVVEMSGSQQFQGEGDNNRNDPSLHLTAAEKSRFFQSLERKLADRLIKDVNQLTRGR